MSYFENINVSNSATNPVNIKSGSKTSSTSVTRPNDTTGYTSGDVVGASPAANLEFANVTGIAGGTIIINRLSLRIDVGTLPTGMSSFRLHLYNASPTAIADNTAYNLPSGDRDKYLGYIDIDVPIDLGDTLYVEMKNIGFNCTLANGSTTLYGILQTLGAYTPTAQTVKAVTLNTLEV